MTKNMKLGYFMALNDMKGEIEDMEDSINSSGVKEDSIVKQSIKASLENVLARVDRLAQNIRNQETK